MYFLSEMFYCVLVVSLHFIHTSTVFTRIVAHFLAYPCCLFICEVTRCLLRCVYLVGQLLWMDVHYLLTVIFFTHNNFFTHSAFVISCAVCVLVYGGDPGPCPCVWWRTDAHSGVWLAAEDRPVHSPAGGHLSFPRHLSHTGSHEGGKRDALSIG